MLAWSISGEDSSWLADSGLLPVSSHGFHIAQRMHMGQWRWEGSEFLILLIRPQMLSDYDPTHMTSFNLSYFRKASSADVITLGVLGLQGI